MAARKCLQCGGPMPKECHGNAGLCSEKCRRRRRNARTQGYKADKYQSDPEYRGRMLARFKAYRDRVGPAELSRRRKAAICKAAAPRREPTAEEVEALVAEQMKCLPEWWGEKGDD